MKISGTKRLFIVALLVLSIFNVLLFGSFNANYNTAKAIPQDFTISNFIVTVNPSTPQTEAQYILTFSTSNSMNSDDAFVLTNFVVGMPTPTNSTLLNHITVNGVTANVQYVGQVATTGGYAITLRITLSQALAAGPVTIIFDSSAGIYNPSAGTYQMSIQGYVNSTYTNTFQSRPYSIGAGSITSLNVTVNPTLVSAPARYTITFKTSTSGALSANVDTISIQFPTGTHVPASIAPSYVTVNGTACATAPTIVQGSNTITFTVPVNVYASNSVTVVISELAQIENPPTASSYVLTVWTSKDTQHVSSNYYSITASSITKPKVTVSPSTVQAEAQYTIQFNVSTSGALSANVDTIVITFPSSTYIPATVSASDVKVNNVVCSNVSKGPSTDQITITTPVYVANSGTVIVTILPSFGIKNPQTAGTYTLKVHTSKDPTDVESESFTIGSSKISNVSVTVVPNMQKSAASYIIQFTTGAAGALTSGDTVTVNFPSGTTLPSSMPSSYVSVNSLVPSSIIVSGYSVTITLPANFSALAFQTVVITFSKRAGIINPTEGNYTLSVKTSKEPTLVTSKSYSIKGLPKVNISVNPPTPNGKNGFYITQPKVTLSLSSSSVSAYIYYRIDSNNAFEKYASVITMPEGTHTLYYYVVDSLGNKGDIQSKVFNVDITPPKLVITAPSDNTVVYTNSITISGSVQGSASLTINGQQVTPTNTGLFTYTAVLSKEGKNTFNIIAEDEAGNKASKTLNIIYVKRITIIMQVGNKYVYVNGQQKLLSYPPFIVNNRTMVPLRFISETFNAQVLWDPIFKIVTIKLNNKIIRVQVGNKTYDNGGKAALLDAPPIIKNGHTFVPLRLIIEAFGGEVTWDPKMQIINIVYPKP